MSSGALMLDEVADLMARLRGVEVLERRQAGSTAVLEIACADTASAERFLRLCAAANVAMTPSRRPAAADHTGCPHFSLVADMTAFDTIQEGYLQLLAIHLVWHLHHSGTLSAAAANGLLRGWHAMPVGS